MAPAEAGVHPVAEAEPEHDHSSTVMHSDAAGIAATPEEAAVEASAALVVAAESPATGAAPAEQARLFHLADNPLSPDC